MRGGKDILVVQTYYIMYCTRIHYPNKACHNKKASLTFPGNKNPGAVIPNLVWNTPFLQQER